jgi:hypothetical protein
VRQQGRGDDRLVVVEFNSTVSKMKREKGRRGSDFSSWAQRRAADRMATRWKRRRHGAYRGGRRRWDWAR